MENFSIPMNRAADISECGRYRWSLYRIWGVGPIAMYILLNPSTADAHKDDPTIRRLISFSKAADFGGFIVTNLFAFRSTSPRELKQQGMRKGEKFIIGRSNDQIILESTNQVDFIIPAWGNYGRLYNRGEKVLSLIEDSKPLLCFGKTKQGQPEHPLYIPQERQFTPLYENP